MRYIRFGRVLNRTLEKEEKRIGQLTVLIDFDLHRSPPSQLFARLANEMTQRGKWKRERKWGDFEGEWGHIGTYDELTYEIPLSHIFFYEDVSNLVHSKLGEDKWEAWKELIALAVHRGWVDERLFGAYE